MEMRTRASRSWESLSHFAFRAKSISRQLRAWADSFRTLELDLRIAKTAIDLDAVGVPVLRCRT